MTSSDDITPSPTDPAQPIGYVLALKYHGRGYVMDWDRLIHPDLETALAEAKSANGPEWADETERLGLTGATHSSVYLPYALVPVPTSTGREARCQGVELTFEGVSTPHWTRQHCCCIQHDGATEPASRYECPQHGVEADSWRAGVRAAQAHLASLLASGPSPHSVTTPAARAASSASPVVDAYVLAEGSEDPLRLMATRIRAALDLQAAERGHGLDAGE